MRLTPHFDLSEFITSGTASRLKIDNSPNDEILAELQLTATFMEQVRRILGVVILVQSGYRSPALNRAVGGAPNSAHMYGKAVDFIAPSFGPPDVIFEKLRECAAELQYDQLILEYDAWVHIARASQSPRLMAFGIGCTVPA